MIADPPVTFDGKKYLLDGLEVPRVSSIIGVLSKPGIDAWKRKVGFEEADRISRTSTELGTRVHAACERINRGETLQDVADTAGLELVPYVEAYDEWFCSNVREVVGAEQLVYSRTWKYAGTADLVALLGDDALPSVIDLKTSNSVSETYRLQLAAYAAALVEMGTPIQRRVIVQVPSREPGVLRVVEFDDDSRDWIAFRAARFMWQWQKDHSQDWRKGR